MVGVITVLGPWAAGVEGVLGGGRLIGLGWVGLALWALRVEAGGCLCLCLMLGVVSVFHHVGGVSVVAW
jgi:hypothetical protein